MLKEKINPVVRLLPSMTDFAFLMPLIFIFAGMHGAKTLLADGDTGWHIRTGEWIMRYHQVPQKDLYSFTEAGKPWFAWEWLWDVIFAWLHQNWGLAAVVVASALIIALTSALFFRLAYHKSGSPLAAMALTFLAMAESSIHFLARPHLITILFAVVFCTILERIREQNRTKLLYWLPLLTVLWMNLHGGWFIGVVLIGLYGAGELAEGLFAARPGAFAVGLRRMLPYFACAMGCLAASLCGPYTYHLHVHIWQYLTDSFQREHIEEMLPINFLNPAARYFEIMLLAGGAACIWHLRRKRYTECLLVVFFAHLALIACRNIPIFGITAGPAIALAVTEWLRKLEDAPVAAWLQNLAKGLRSASESLAEMEPVGRTHLVSAAAVLLVTAILYAPAPPKNFRARFDGETFPVKAVASMGGPDWQGRIFTYDQWGDYLIYQNPQHQVFMDGRSDFYGSKFVKKYLEIMNVNYKWQQYLNEYGVDTVMLQTDAPLTGALKESSRWRVVYDDGKAIIFRTGSRAEGPQVSAVTGGKDRDRKITSNQPSDRTITKTKT
jgi:hypothetical protein